jgi:hypothetical protein
MGMTALRSALPRRAPLLLAVVCAVGLASGLLPAAAQPEASEIDVLTASRDEVRAELAALDERYAIQLAQVEQARASSRRAEADAAAARTRVRDAERRLEQARDEVADYAVEAYMRPPAADTLRVLSIEDADEAGFAHNLMEIMSEDRQQVVDELVEREAALLEEQAAADRAADTAQRAASEAEVQLVDLDRVRAAQQELAASLDERLDDALAEAAALAAIDQAAADQLVAEELALREEGPTTPIPAERGGGGDVVTVEEPDASTTVPPPTSPPTTAVGPTPPSTTRPPAPRPPTTRPPAPRPPSRPPTSGVTWADVTSVGGIYVHRSIAADIRRLLDAATAAGLNLRGGGYRDPAAQIATRRANCGPTYYDIYEKPSSQCTPPTARPGRSMHERGMAIDFTSSGRLITSRSDPAFVWLRNNAARYGLYNLPSEPWHWSTNGN